MAEKVPFRQRIRFSSKLALFHLFGSLIIAALCAWLVMSVWYPFPYDQLAGGLKLLLMVAAVDVVCGPLLTLILASPAKSRRETVLDFSLVILIQLGALAYGLHTVYAARPVYLAFDVDRFTIASAAQIGDGELAKADEGFRTLPLSGVRRISLKPVPPDQIADSAMLSLGGIEPVARPTLWMPYNEAEELPKIRAAMQPVSVLLAARRDAAQQAAINSAVAVAGLPQDKLYFLPFTSDKNKEWSALLNEQGNIVGYMAVDGFIEDVKFTK